MNNYLANFTSQVALFSANHAELVSSSLQSIDLKNADIDAQSMTGFWPADPTSWMAVVRPYIVQDGTLFVPVRGVLMHNFPFQLMGHATGYEYIREAVARGVEDASVKGIAFLVNSPGGTAFGCFDTADFLYAQRSKKPMVAIVNPNCCSAAYAIASVAHKIRAPRVCNVANIGVITTHVDVSEMNSKMGIKVTHVYAGKHKVDGSPHEKLSSEAKERIQARIDEVYSIYVSAVARNRGLSEEEVRATEALDYGGEEALSLGLIDEIVAYEDALATLSADFDLISTPSKDEPMTTATQTPTVDLAAQHATELAAARAEGRAEGASAERTRISAILNAPEAAKRDATARHLALSMDMAADAAIALLAKTPEATSAAPIAPAATGNAFEQAMKSGNPELGQEGNEQGGERKNPLLSAFRETHAIKA